MPCLRGGSRCSAQMALSEIPKWRDLSYFDFPSNKFQDFLDADSWELPVCLSGGKPGGRVPPQEGCVPMCIPGSTFEERS